MRFSIIVCRAAAGMYAVFRPAVRAEILLRVFAVRAPYKFQKMGMEVGARVFTNLVEYGIIILFRVFCRLFSPMPGYTCGKR